VNVHGAELDGSGHESDDILYTSMSQLCRAYGTSVAEETRIQGTISNVRTPLKLLLYVDYDLNEHA
jgi:hypothetical protein